MPPYSSAFADHTSATGFEPWYGGRSSGVPGLGRSVYGFERYDSAAWQTTSSPADDVTSLGKVRASSGSTIAWLQRR